MNKMIVCQAETTRNQVAESQPRQMELDIDMPDVPVLPETILCLDLEAHGSCVDLRTISQLILEDVGATVQILRLMGRDCDNPGDRLTRIEDCISDLGLNACLEAVSAQTVIHDNRYEAIEEIWTHSAQIAKHSRMVAEEMPEINPDEAYLVGLLHAIGLLPTVLGWSNSDATTDNCGFTGFKIAKKWSLPHFVVEFFREMHLAGHPSPWKNIVRQAHQRAGRSCMQCPVE